MFSKMALRTVLKSSSIILRECGALSKLTGTKSWSCTTSLTKPGNNRGSLTSPLHCRFSLTVRSYARVARKKQVPESQLSDLSPDMLKMDFANVPLVQTVDDVVKRLLSLELASHKEKLQLKKEQLVKKVQRNESDRSSVEVKVAVLTARIRNYKEHLQKHHKDKANKRHMLMAVDRRKKLLKRLRLVNHDAFEKVCSELGITYTFPPEYYRRITRRWLAKKALCIKVYQEVKKQRAEQKRKVMQGGAKTPDLRTKAPDVR